MKLTATSEIRIAKPQHEVFEAIVDPARMSHYFISSASARPQPGKTVTWRWEDVGAEAEVQVHEVESPRLFSFSWGGPDAPTRVDIVLEPEGEAATAVRVSDGPYESDAEGIEQFRGQVQGWTHFLLCLKAYMEFGIDLRAGSVTQSHREAIAASRAAGRD
jgi:uncharacterized protein YndB with AHSA1/START domain